MRNKIRFWIVILSVLCFSSLATAMDIDTLADGDFSLILSDPGSISVGVAATSAIGGYRDIAVTYAGDGGADSYDVMLVDRTGLSTRLTWNSDDGIFGSVKLLYNANGVGLGGIDITDGGTHEFLVTSSSGDGGAVDIKFTVIDQLGNVSYIEQQFLVTGIEPILHFLPFDSWIGSADLTNTDSIEILFSTNADFGFGGDYKFGAIATGTPEPATLLVLALGLLPMLRRRRIV